MMSIPSGLSSMASTDFLRGPLRHRRCICRRQLLFPACRMMFSINSQPPAKIDLFRVAGDLHSRNNGSPGSASICFRRSRRPGSSAARNAHSFQHLNGFSGIFRLLHESLNRLCRSSRPVHQPFWFHQGFPRNYPGSLWIKGMVK